ncbi:hypothetical protein HMPREF9402_1035 [Turicibacter sp. HGF1]|uniref:hypothetical protein n=1 Tax=Turicibacter sp. HGF1 TaxID=910310 RepID=UPI0001FD99CF|nr:hypothetical protein [Turicibacter sp. HGF1]EGC93283.1 hypothetical protein HMPREF9402_1035 [Turicibacter sp. HGF1]
MNHEAIEFSRYPICDTDIWVRICLGNLFDVIFKKYKKLVVADAVENEILKWERENSNFTFIANKYNDYKDKGLILVIDHMKDIRVEDRLILEQILFDLGFESCFYYGMSEKDKAEYVSALYADYFKMPFMKSNDHAFSDGGKGKVLFPKLLVKDWYKTTEELIFDTMVRIRIRSLVDEKCKRMSDERQKNLNKYMDYKNEDLQNQLALLKTKFCS